MTGKEIENSKPDIYEVYQTTTTKKLDADQYSADDLDGVTESLFGSGSLAYASLQAVQKGDVMDVNKGFLTADNNAGVNVFNNAPQNIRNIMSSNDQFKSGDSTSTNTDRLFDAPQSSTITGNEGIANFTSTTVGSLGASTLSSDTGTFAPKGSGLSLANGLNGKNGTSANASNGNDGQNGNNGQNGEDGHTNQDQCTPKTINIFDIDVDVDFGDVSNTINNSLVQINNTLTTLTVSVDSTINVVNNILVDVNLGNVADITNITNSLETISETLIQNISHSLNQITEVKYNVATLVKTILQDVGDKNMISNITETITDLGALENVANTIQNFKTSIETLHNKLINVKQEIADLEITDVSQNLVTTLETIGDSTTTVINDVEGNISDILGDLSLDNILGQGFDNNGGTDSDVVVDTNINLLDHPIIDPVLDIVIDPVEDLVGDIDVELGLDTDLLSHDQIETDNAAGDNDIVINTDIELVDNTLGQIASDISLDPVEEITGDIDLNLGTAIDVLGDMAEPIVNDGDGGTGEDTLLSQIGNVLEDTAEHILPSLNSDESNQDDLALQTDINAIDENLADVEIDALINPVEEIIGDIDLDISSAIDLLSSDDAANVSNQTNESDHTDNWTESVIGEGLFDDLTNSLINDLDILPDPAGTVAEGLGALNMEPDVDLNALGGLFG